MKEHRAPNGWRILELEDGDLPKEAYTHLLKVGQEGMNYNGRVRIRIAQEAVTLLGPHGKLLGDDKRAVQTGLGDDEILFNACVFDTSGTEIWFGDLNLTQDRPRLVVLGRALGKVFVTPENPYRGQGLPDSPAQDPLVLEFS